MSWHSLPSFTSCLALYTLHTLQPPFHGLFKGLHHPVFVPDLKAVASDGNLFCECLWKFKHGLIVKSKECIPESTYSAWILVPLHGPIETPVLNWLLFHINRCKYPSYIISAWASGYRSTVTSTASISLWLQDFFLVLWLAYYTLCPLFPSPQPVRQNMLLDSHLKPGPPKRWVCTSRPPEAAFALLKYKAVVLILAAEPASNKELCSYFVEFLFFLADCALLLPVGFCN